MTISRHQWMMILASILFMGTATWAIHPTPQKSIGSHFEASTPDISARLVQIRQQVQKIVRAEKNYRRVNLTHFVASSIPYHQAGATAYFQGQQLRKVVIWEPTGAVAGMDIHEWYFAKGHPIFMAQTVRWYRYEGTSGRVLPRFRDDRESNRYYLQRDQLVAMTSTAKQEEGSESLSTTELRQEMLTIQMAIRNQIK